MASSSSSANFPFSFYCSSNSASAQVRPRKYGVFLNFRGKDTREGFVSFLYRDINRQGIHAYLDSAELDNGADIPTIMDAIQDSNIAVVLFSKEYASSPFCLDELVKIMECRQTTGLQVLVVFYRVDPVDVENQTGCFSKAFKTHKKSCDKKKIAEWRTALKNAASVKGWDYNSKDIRDEADLVDKIVKDICKKIRHIYPSNDLKGLGGMHLRVKEIELLLRIGEVNDVRIVGIWGMGGIGKTTLAKAIFDKYSSHFQSSCFLANVRESSKSLPELKEELIASLLNKANASIRTSNGSSSTFLMNQLQHKKVLIVLDDLDKFEQIESLAGEHEWFGNGSRVIITSRERQVLKNGVDSTYEVQPLVAHEALKLFSLFAFKQSHVPANFLDLTDRVLKYCNGLPLALKVLGLFLYDRSKKEWESALNEPEKTLDLQVQEVLKISYNGLDDNSKEIFLHIACFFKGEPVADVERILNSCGFSATIGLSKLTDKALIHISDFKVEMHDLLQDMGRYIVSQESGKEPGKLSRLWNPEDICDVLEKNRGTSAIEGISIDMSRINNPVCVVPTAFSNMDQAKFLRFNDNRSELFLWLRIEVPKMVDCPEGLESLPKKLRYLKWDFYPLKALPSNVYFENLVELDISHGKIERLWTGKQNLSSLRVMRASCCGQLIELPDFSGARNLQIIDFSGCERLREVSPSIEYAENLKELNLSGCPNIKRVPSTKGLRSLAKLLLQRCALKNLSELSESIEELDLSYTGIEEVPSCSELRSLKKLDLYGCLKLQKFHDLSTSVEELRMSGNDHFDPDLKNLDLARLQMLVLRNWRKLGNILEMNLGRLRELDLSHGHLDYIGSIKQLSCLESLTIVRCPGLESLPELPPHLTHLNATDCVGLQMVTNSKFALVETWEKLLDFRVNFLFWNCHELNQDARGKILSHAQQMIRLFAQRAVYQLPKSVGRKDDVSFVYPGNEIPDWIDRQSTGSSITFDLPRNLCDDRNFLGFVLCAINDVKSVWYESLNVYCDCLFEFGDAAGNLKLTVGLWNKDKSLSQWKGTHVSLWYGTRLHQAMVSSLGGEDYYNKATFQFYSSSGQVAAKCGVRLLYIDEATREKDLREKEKETKKLGHEKRWKSLFKCPWSKMDLQVA